MSKRFSGSSSSEFASVARVVFESARKSGLVTAADDTPKDYAKQLMVFRQQSKKRGGSLGQVSYNIAEFVASQRRFAESEEANEKTAASGGESSVRTTAQKVPLLNIDFLKKPPKQQPPSVVVPPHPGSAAQPANVQLHIPLATPMHSLPPQPQQQQQQQQAATTAAVPTLDVLRREVLKEQEHATMAAAAATQQQQSPTRSRVAIAEDTPLFGMSAAVQPSAARPLAEPHTPKLTSQPLAATTMAVPKPRVLVVPRPRVLPASVTEAVPATATIAAAPLPSAAAPSVEEWENQREREILQLRQAQQEEEDRQLAVRREQDFAKLGAAWLVERASSTPPPRPSDPFYPFNERIFFARTWEAALNAFSDAAQTVSVAAAMPVYTIAATAEKLRLAPPEMRNTALDTLAEMLRANRGADRVRKEVLLQKSTAFDAGLVVAEMPVQEQMRLPSFRLRQAASSLAGAGRWEDCLKFIGATKRHVRDPFCTIEVAAMRRFASTKLPPEVLQTISATVVTSLRAQLTRLGHEHHLLLARMARGAERFNMITTLIASPDADESAYALALSSRRMNVDTLMEEMNVKKINVQDPKIATMLMRRFVESDPRRALNILKDQEALGSSNLRFQILVAIDAISHLRTAEDARYLLDVIKRASRVSRKLRLQHFAPLLYEMGLHREVVELYDLYRDEVDIVKHVPSVVAYVNDSLKHEGRPPLTSATVSAQVAPLVAAGLKEASSSSTTSGRRDGQREEAQAEQQQPAALLEQTETMLAYAKERNWSAALNVLRDLPRVPSTSSLTLLYNCALSAASDEPEVVERILSRMKDERIGLNATTYNTAISAYAKTENQWTEALRLFGSVPVGVRDTSTYSMTLSLLSKHTLWQEAVALFQNMKASAASQEKPPAIIFSLAIQATHRESWSATLGLFQELVRTHGSAAVKELVATRVLRSLEASAKLTEARWVEKELQGGKKKKKKE